MEIADIKDLMKSFDKSECSSFEIRQGDFELRFEKTGKPSIGKKLQVKEKAENASVAEDPIEELPEPSVEGEVIKAPLVGIFYAAPSPEAEAYVQVGSRVKAGQVLCLIEAMKMMSEVTAPKDGIIKKIYVKNQDVIGFDDPLFLIGD